MRNFLIEITPFLIWFFAISETLLFVLFSLRIKKVKTHKVLFILCAAVCFGLAFDAIIQAIGFLLGKGSALHALSQIRFILHGILIPLLIPISFLTYGVHSRKKMLAVYIVTGVVVIFGIAMGAMTKLEFVHFAGIMRYAQDKELTPAFAQIINLILSFGGVIPLIVMGVFHLIKTKSPYLFIAGLVMFFFAAFGGAIKNPETNQADLNFVITMLGEDLMVFFFSFELHKKLLEEKEE